MQRLKNDNSISAYSGRAARKGINGIAKGYLFAGMWNLLRVLAVFGGILASSFGTGTETLG